MKNYSHYLLISVVVFLTSSCISDNLPSDPLDYFKNPPVVIEPSATITPDKPILFGADMQLLSDSIAVIRKWKEEHHLAFVNLNTGEVLRELITKGQGPGEIMTMFLCPQYDKNKLLIDDPNLRTIFNVDYNRAINDNNYMIEPVLKYENRALEFIPIDTFFIAAGLRTIDNRFQIFDSKGELIATCLNYDKASKYSHVPDRVYSTGLTGSFAIHPNGERFVFGAKNSGCIQIFNFTSNEITKHKDLIFNDPVITCENNACATSPKAIKSTETIVSSDKFFYVLYSGDTLEKNINGPTNNLLVFDWDGNPVKRYELQQPITTFAINSTGNKLYGIALETDASVIVQYDLE